mmetsp:Transcript_68787/g.212716  ORF Transcript_68787/g.212716 Transcript_68787/m.212716 type:complete len:231 (+) Transcript_68787:1015-1707(+)
MLLVLWPGIALAQGPVDAQLQGLLHVLGLGGDDALGAHAHGDVVEERLREALLQGLHVRVEEIRSHQPHAAVDVEANAAGRDDRLRVAHVKGRDVADGKAVAAVDVGQTDGVLADARQGGHVADLLHRGQEASHVGGLTAEAPQLVEHEPLQVRVHEELAGDVHVRHEALPDGVHGVRLLRQEPHLFIEGPLRLHGGRMACAPPPPHEGGVEASVAGQGGGARCVPAARW